MANQAVLETFANCSVAWQAIPHWDTGDPAQTQVPKDDVNAPGTTTSIEPWAAAGTVTLATTIASSPNTLLGLVVAKTVELAATVDKAVLSALGASTTTSNFDDTGPGTLLTSLIDARALVENNGSRAPSSLFTTTAGLKTLSQLVNGSSILESLLDGANINSLHRVEALQDPVPQNDPARAILLGRRQRIVHGGAAEASPGEEPVDLAVSVPPSLEVVGESGANMIALSIRMRGAVRIKDSRSVIVLN